MNSKVKRHGDYLISDTTQDSIAYQDMFKKNGVADRQKTADMMKKLLEMEDAMESIARRARTFTSEQVQATIAANKAKIEELQKQQDILNKAVEYIGTLPFKEGDAVFHKDLGNVLISTISFNDNLNEESTYFTVVNRNGHKKEVPMKEIVPITEATKILFGKK